MKKILFKNKRYRLYYLFQLIALSTLCMFFLANNAIAQYDSNHIGTLSLQEKVVVRKKENKENDKKSDDVDENDVDEKGVKIDSAKIIIIDGAIRYLTVFTEKGQFINRQTSISLSKYYKKYHSLVSEQDRGLYIINKEAIKYDPNHGGYVLPDNGTYMLYSDNNNMVNLKRSISYGIDLKSFTDAGALLGNKPNGLVSVEGAGRLLINVIQWRNSPSYSFQYFELYGGYSKFDSKFSTYLVPDSRIITPTEIFQKSRAVVGGRLSLLKYYGNESIEIDFTASGQVNFSQIAPFSDSLKLTPANIYSVIPEVNFSFSPGALFHVTLTPGFIFLRKIDYSKSSVAIANANDNNLFRLSMLFALNTSKSSNSNKVFFRINMFYENGGNGSGFTQFQIGYNKNLGDLLKTNLAAENNRHVSER